MKKIFLILVTCLLCVALALPSLGTTASYLYLPENNEIKGHASSYEKNCYRFTSEYLTNDVLKDGETVDQSKIVIHTDKIVPRYVLTPSEVLQMLQAEDTLAYIENIKAKEHFFLCDYDGEVIENFGFKINRFLQLLTVYYPDSVTQRIMDPDKLLSAIKAAGAEEYRPIFQFHYGYMCFALAEKDGQRYLLYLPVDETDPHVASDAAQYAEFTKQQQELITKQIWTIDEAVTFMEELESYSRTLVNEEKIYMGGTGETETPEKENVTTPPTALWIGIGGGIAVALAVTLLLIFKKKSA